MKNDASADHLLGSSSGDSDEESFSEEVHFLDLATVLEQERRFTRAQFANRAPDGRPSSTPFALGFSGGGMRAAAFQCGVLWRLARMNLLKDVELITAVSGGGYIAGAFASHCLAEDPPKPGQVKAWYERVVAKTVVRMQQNAGDFVRDFNRSGCGISDDNSGCIQIPIALDVVILICTLVSTMLVNPFFFTICFLMPCVVFTEHFFGDDMREAFCVHAPAGEDSDGFLPSVLHLRRSNGFKQMLWVLLGTFVATLVANVIAPKDPLYSGKVPKGQHVQHGNCFMLMYGVKAFLIRFTTFWLLYIVTIFSSLMIQTGLFQVHFEGANSVFNKFCPGGNETSFDCNLTEKGCSPVFEIYFFWVLGALFITAVLIMPYLGSTWAIDLAAVTGPLVILVFISKLIRFRIFGPYTKQNLTYSDGGFDIISWEWATKVSLILAMVLLPLYGDIRAILHTYYMRCLSRNFFAHGDDPAIGDIQTKCDYCPLLIMTGTSSDYRSPIVGDEDTISELSFSPLHCGSEETGYISQPHYRTLGKCTALTAAGCIDAVALTLSTFLTLRFWLQVMNLSWGNYILFNPESVVKL
jgi:hypothetical protein